MSPRAIIAAAACVGALAGPGPGLARADDTPAATPTPTPTAILHGGVAGAGGGVTTHRGEVLRTWCEVDRLDATVADRVTLTITLDVLTGFWATFPDVAANVTLAGTRAVPAVGDKPARGPVPEDKLGQWRVVSVRDDAPVPTSTGTRIVRRIVLEPFLPGVYSVPELVITYGGRGGGEKSGTTRTAHFEVNVRSLLTEEEQKAASRPVAPNSPGAAGAGPGASTPPAPSSPPSVSLGEARGLVLPAPARAARTWILGAGFGVVFIVGGLAVALMRGRRREPDAYSKAVASLRALRATASARDPGVCDAIAASIRRALADRADPRALGMTSAELADAAPAWPTFGVGEVGEIAAILHACDQARFAGAPGPGGSDDAGSLVERAIRLLEPLANVRPGSVAGGGAAAGGGGGGGGAAP